MLNFFLYMWCVGVIISRWSFYTISFSPTATWRANTCTKLWSAQAVIPSKSFSFLFFFFLQIIFCQCIADSLKSERANWQIYSLGCLTLISEYNSYKTFSWYDNYWIPLSQNIRISRCLSSYLFSIAVGLGN